VQEEEDHHTEVEAVEDDDQEGLARMREICQELDDEQL
jgi:hypothetical protein